MSSATPVSVLCVDDDARIVAGLSLHLRRDYRVLTALSGAEALERLHSAPGSQSGA